MPDWSKLEMARTAAVEIHDHIAAAAQQWPAITAHEDQASALVRDDFDSLDLCLHDEQTLYHAVAVLQVVALYSARLILAGVPDNAAFVLGYGRVTTVLLEHLRAECER